ncbi:hypothetical protein X566_07020 [Afipia sp. P52-10]|jgi:hypothetical protein|nr:hypothetical protein X566_07020 [Afipia sp. P52-10]
MPAVLTFACGWVEPIAALGRPSLKDICDSARQTFLGAIDTVKSSMTSN